MKFLILIIFLYLFKFFNSSEIVIPFHSKLSEIPKDLKPQDFIHYLTSNELYSKVQIGTPPQELDFLIDFENYNTYVVKDEKLVPKVPRFLDNISSTFTHLSSKIYFSDSDFSFAINSSDIVTIGETLKNYNYTFLQALSFRNDKARKYPGIIGFNVVQNDDPFHRESGLVYQLKSKNIINNYLFTLSFNENDYNGNIIIGKNIYEKYQIDEIEEFSSDYCYVSNEYKYYWGWHYLTTYFNSDLLDIKDALIRPELGVIILNSNYKDIFSKKFFEEKIKEGKCYDMYYGFYCDKDVNIDIGELNFEIKRSGLQFSLNSKDLFVEYNNKLIFLIEFEGRVDKKEVKLGYPFLKKYDMIFNIDNRHVGFYNFKIKYEYKKESETEQKNENNNNDEENKKEEKIDKIDNSKVNKAKDKNNKNDNNITMKIIFSLLLVFFIILIIYCIFTVFRKCERKRKGKIFEELFL